MGITMNTPRESDGRYAMRRLDRACKCGHALGCHTADRDAKAKIQPCLEDGCDCEFFTLARR